MNLVMFLFFMYTETSIYIYFYLRDLFFDVGTNVHMHERLAALSPPSFYYFFFFLVTAVDIQSNLNITNSVITNYWL